MKDFPPPVPPGWNKTVEDILPNSGQGFTRTYGMGNFFGQITMREARCWKYNNF